MNRFDIKISSTQLSIDECYQFVLDSSCGGNCIFVGTTRNHNKGKSVIYLDFDSYQGMAIKEMEKIANKAIEKYDLKKIAIHHRSGRVEIKDIAVIIAVSSGHRDDAFKACRFIIDALKESVPIWKKEFLEDGSYWVNAHP
jgi:molybdopterin synthase catalytic subunit